MAETKYIVFSLGNQKYSTTLDKINGIEQVYNIVPVPMGADNIKGIIHLRNNIVPVFDIKGQFGIEDEIGDTHPQLLVAETHNIQLGIEVDDVIGIVEVSDEDVKDVPSVVKNDNTGYLENIIKVALEGSREPEIIISINVDSIMSDSEFDSVYDAIEHQNAEG